MNYNYFSPILCYKDLHDLEINFFYIISNDKIPGKKYINETRSIYF